MNEVARERAMSFLKAEHQARIEGAYRAFVDEEGFAKVASLREIAEQGFSLSIPLYVKRSRASVSAEGEAGESLADAFSRWEEEGREFWQRMDALTEVLDGLMDERRSPDR